MPRNRHWDWMSIVVGLAVILIPISGGPCSFGSKWIGYWSLLCVGALNVGIGLYCLLHRSRHG